MDPINIPPLFMLAYIAAPWIRHGILLKIWINNRENILYYILLYIYIPAAWMIWDITLW